MGGMVLSGLPRAGAALSRSLEDVGDLGWRPFAAARRWHAARVQNVGDLAQAPPLGPERLDQRQGGRGETIRYSLHALGAFAAHLGQARVAEPRAQRLFGARRDHGPLLLGERGID